MTENKLELFYIFKLKNNGQLVYLFVEGMYLVKSY